MIFCSGKAGGEEMGIGKIAYRKCDEKRCFGKKIRMLKIYQNCIDKKITIL